jgi:hypothetical protein
LVCEYNSLAADDPNKLFLPPKQFCGSGTDQFHKFTVDDL